MIENNDWRLQGQEKYLTGVKLIRTPFTPLSKTWDHEHCEFCMKKPEDNKEQKFYCTLDNYRWICEDKHTWICPECYEDFKEMFRWELLDSE